MALYLLSVILRYHVFPFFTTKIIERRWPAAARKRIGIAA